MHFQQACRLVRTTISKDNLAQIFQCIFSLYKPYPSRTLAIITLNSCLSLTSRRSIPPAFLFSLIRIIILFPLQSSQKWLLLLSSPVSSTLNFILRFRFPTFFLPHNAPRKRHLPSSIIPRRFPIGTNGIRAAVTNVKF